MQSFATPFIIIILCESPSIASELASINKCSPSLGLSIICSLQFEEKMTPTFHEVTFKDSTNGGFQASFIFQGEELAKNVMETFEAVWYHCTWNMKKPNGKYLLLYIPR